MVADLDMLKQILVKDFDNFSDHTVSKQLICYIEFSNLIKIMCTMIVLPSSLHTFGILDFSDMLQIELTINNVYI